MTKLRYINRLTKADKPLISLALSNAGIKSRIRICRNSFRIVFEGEQSEVARVLNAEGYRTLSGEIDRYSFNQSNELFIHGSEF